MGRREPGGGQRGDRDVATVAERSSAGRFAAEVMCLQTAAQFGDHTGGPRLHELESIVAGPRAGLPRGSPTRFVTVTVLNWQRYQKNSSESVTSLPPSTRPPTPPLRTAAGTSADRR